MKKRILLPFSTIHQLSMKNLLLKFLFLSILSLFTYSIFAQSEADKILGTYLVKDDQSSEKVKIKIYKNSNGTYSGRICWVENPYFKDGSPKCDIMNPDKSKRNTPGDKIQMLFHFRYNAKDKKWVDGEIYDPVHGKTYKCQMWFINATTLQLRGYIGIPAIGRSMKWKKIN